MKSMNAKKATFTILSRMIPGDKFTGYGLTVRVNKLVNEIHMSGTMLRYMREYREESGRVILNTNKRKSMYEVMG